jgi:hypothetical protein
MNVGGSGGVPPDWIDPDYTRRRTITFDNPTDREQDDVPLLVRLDDSRVDYGVMQNSGADLRFYDEDGELLPHEIELWRAGEDSFVWIQLDSLPSSGATVTMYYGHPGATDGSDPEEVWSNDFVAVWHMGGGVDDSLDLHDGSPSGVSTVSGQVGEAQRFGDDDYVGIGDHFDGLFTTGATITAWIYVEGWGGTGFGRIVDKSTGDTGQNGWALFVTSANETFGFRRAHETTDGRWEAAANALSIGQWHHVALIYADAASSTQPVMFLDGTPIGLDSSTDPVGNLVSDAGSPIRIGNAGSLKTKHFEGKIDEVRFSSDIRFPSWIEVQHASMRDQLASFGAEEQL